MVGSTFEHELADLVSVRRRSRVESGCLMTYHSNTSPLTDSVQFPHTFCVQNCILFDSAHPIDCGCAVLDTLVSWLSKKSFHMVAEQVDPTTARSHGKHSCGELCSRSWTGSNSKLTRAIRQQQAQQPQGAPPTAGTKRGSHSNSSCTSESLTTLIRSRKAKTSGKHLVEKDHDGRAWNERSLGGPVECSQGGWSQTDDEFVDTNTQKCIRASRGKYNVFARYTKSEASTIVMSGTESDGAGAWRKTPWHPQQKHTGTNVQGAT